MLNILFVSGGLTVTSTQNCPHVNSVSVVTKEDQSIATRTDLTYS